jgi:hypothetical protein
VYDNFAVLNNQKPQKEYMLGVIPDYINITYKLAIFTDYVEQMNQLIEGLEFASDSYWGDPEKYVFRAIITSFPTPVVLENAADRVSKSEVTIMLQGYIIPRNINVAMAGPNPKHFVDTTDVIDKKIAALLCHASQHTDPAGLPERMRGWGEMIAEAGGLPKGRTAEAFLVVDTK